ncbi:hypothetical protein EDB86DRAFT_2830555 [Lactarius hatsudake]|nr:hypothetical protein EDB86DRAFT_2830555 [Lactarius hatsudake]
MSPRIFTRRQFLKEGGVIWVLLERGRSHRVKRGCRGEDQGTYTTQYEARPNPGAANARRRTRAGPPGTKKRTRITRRSPRRDNEAGSAENGVPEPADTLHVTRLETVSHTGGHAVLGSLSYHDPASWREAAGMSKLQIKDPGVGAERQAVRVCTAVAPTPTPWSILKIRLLLPLALYSGRYLPINLEYETGVPLTRDNTGLQRARAKEARRDSGNAHAPGALAYLRDKAIGTSRLRSDISAATLSLYSSNEAGQSITYLELNRVIHGALQPMWSESTPLENYSTRETKRSWRNDLPPRGKACLYGVAFSTTSFVSLGGDLRKPSDKVFRDREGARVTRPPKSTPPHAQNSAVHFSTSGRKWRIKP